VCAGGRQERWVWRGVWIVDCGLWIELNVITQSIAVSNTPRHYANSHATHGITRCYLPPGRTDIPALSPAEAAVLDLATPGGMQG